MAKATHKGHCQLCDRLQMLPKGKMAKHGYEVAGWGFFNGTCHGSDHLPYEQSADLIPPMIESMKKQIARTTEWRDEILAPVTEPKAWYREYVRKDNWSGKYVWREIEIITIHHESTDGFEYNTFEYVNHVGKQVRLNDAYGQRTWEEVCTYLNSLKAKEVSQTIKQMQDYLNFLEKRLANFKVTDLIPRKEGE